MKLTDMNKTELVAMKKQWDDEYNSFKAKGLALNMARGKPAPEQLDLSMDMLDVLNSKSSLIGKTGEDYRNYGITDGIPEAKELFSKMIGVDTDEIVVCGNASLNIMYDVISTAFLKGIMGNTPWHKLEKIKFLCPVPGYDRHFAICENFGIEMINIPTSETGPDMDMVEKLVAEDESIKGIWCVPQYSNPTGYVYSDETVKRFAALKPKAADFRIFWDNAYCIHHLTDTPKMILNILEECKKCGNEDMVYIFGSTSKITFAGAGVAVFGSSKNNINSLLKVMGIRTIGYDKINQLRHVEYFKNYEGLLNHMNKHKDVILPKFNAVTEMLEKEIAPLEIGSWTNPQGGYFVSFDSLPGCAKRIVSLCKDAGVTLTGAGAAFPYGKDPEDKNIRIAPTYPSVDELKTAMEIFCLAVKIASAETIL
ncbi:MAG: aminotransferase class I/II-fold pyridoxal phosphate-dependent enzyme [Ruminococcus sp.]|nr:aminotransferase class I/II-fold pyridoxal phosphate-dependent enzyme [Ruminococcus sp.]